MIMAENLNKESFLSKVFDYEKNTDWKYEGELPAVIDSEGNLKWFINGVEQKNGEIGGENVKG